MGLSRASKDLLMNAKKPFSEQRKEYGKKLMSAYAVNDLSKVNPTAPKAKEVRIEVRKSKNANEGMRKHLNRPYGERNRGANWLK